MAVLVTGGAGYIGSVITEELVKEGYEVIVFDNLQQGHREAIQKGAAFFPGDIKDPASLEDLFQHHEVEAVMHLAAETEVETSMINPQRHYQDNVAGGLTLLEAMLKYEVNKIIFSSSAAVYGEPVTSLIEEGHPKFPVNVYGETKLIMERVLGWYNRAYGLKYICLRYFNAAGASELYGEHHRPETHLIPRIIQAAQENSKPVKVFGNTYPTPDGSCVRDYVHVADIARAHILALNKMDSLSGQAFNLGSSSGYSVLEVINAVKRISGVEFKVKIDSRRAGDPAILVASSKLAQSELGWSPRHNLESVVESAWRWTKDHPRGYEP
jgi:UDP-glucose 4-epimerase